MNMDMGMEVHSAPSGMQNADIADVSAKVFRVGRKFTQGIGRGMVSRLCLGRGNIMEDA